MRVCPQRDAECTCQAKIWRASGDRRYVGGFTDRLTGQFQVAHLVDQQILRLQVAVKYTVSVAVVEAFDELIRKFLRRTRLSDHAVFLGVASTPHLDHHRPQAVRCANRVHVLFEVEVDKFKDQVKLLVLVQDVEQPDSGVSC